MVLFGSALCSVRVACAGVLGYPVCLCASGEYLLSLSTGRNGPGEMALLGLLDLATPEGHSLC